MIYLLFYSLTVYCYKFCMADNLALLSDTLRTFQQAACNEGIVTLKCPRGTSITIQVAQYGKLMNDNNICGNDLEQFNPVAVEIVGNSSCKWPNALQYSLLQTVVEACQKKRQCKFHTSPKAFGMDPCPGARKFVEVAYKCRPYEFRSKTGCQNDTLQLSCNPYSRIAIYSASYGRTQFESIQCPQPQGVPEETCLSNQATQSVMRYCHGKRRCTLSADTSTFGTPCSNRSRMYLKVVYTCVPRKVLQDKFEAIPEDDEIQNQDGGFNDNDEFYDTEPGEDNWFREPAAIPPAPKVAADPRTNITAWSTRSTQDVTWSTKVPYSRNDTQEGTIDSIYIYIIISVAASFLLCIGLAITRCVVKKFYSKGDSKAPDISTTEVPNGFNDSISEVDNDIEINAMVPQPISIMKPDFGDTSLGPKSSIYVGRPVPNTYPHHINMYGPIEEFNQPVGTLRRGVHVQCPAAVGLPSDIIVSPRNLNRYSNAQYYYG